MRDTLRAVLLDNNGTCLDDLQVAYGSACATLTHWGVTEMPTLQQYRDGMSSDWKQWYYKYGLPPHVTVDQMNVIRRAYYAEHGHMAEFRPDLERFLRFCQERGLKLAIVSAEVRGILQSFLDRVDLTPYFDHIEAEAWPKGPALVRTLVKLDVSPQEAVYVDDSVEGNETAKAVGIRTIGFTHETAYASETRIRAVGPDATAENFFRVARVLRRWL